MLSRFLSTLTVILALLLATTATAQETEKPAIISTIQSQFNAFSKDNFEQAFTYASPFIKSLFGTPKNFGVMVSRSSHGTSRGGCAFSGTAFRCG